MFAPGYTNDTRRLGRDYVRKTYGGSDAAARASIETACLEGLAQYLPVPRIVAKHAVDVTVMRHLNGRHGQDLIAEGHGHAVMVAAGALLRRLQALPPDLVPLLPGEGKVLVHGDFGAQNMLFNEHCEVTGLLDWEFAHRGATV